MKKSDKSEINIDNNNGVSVEKNEGIIINNNTDIAQLEVILKQLVSSQMEIGQVKAQLEMERRFNDLVSSLYSTIAGLKIDIESVKTALADPGVQFDIRDAELEYMKNGSEELKNILVNIMAKRIEVNNEELLRIVLSEAIKVAPKLLESHMKILSLNFIFTSVFWHGIATKSDFYDRCRKILIPLSKNLPTKNSDFQHISYCGAGEIQVTSKKFLGWFRNYSGIFSKGFDVNSNPSLYSIFQRYPKLFIKCLNDNSKYQFSYLSYNLLEKEMEKMNLTQSEIDEVKKVHDNSLFSQDEIKNDIINSVPEMKILFDYIDKNRVIQQIMLTSVGIVIAIQYIEYTTGDKFNYSLWI